MNEVRALQIGCAEAKGVAECKRDGTALLTASVSGRKARGMARAAGCVKPTAPANKHGEQRSEAGNAGGSGRGKQKPARPARGRGRIGREDVPSVAELIAIVCNVADNRKKRVKLAEAFRERGLDESKLAAMYSGIAEKLSRSKELGAVGVAAAKLLFDVLKELADWLEPEKSLGNGDVCEAPQFVRLIHNVPRPVRPE